MAQRVRTLVFSVMCFFSPSIHLSLDTPHSPVSSLNHPIRPRQHIWRNSEADLLRGFQINDELKLGWLLDRKIGGLCAFKYLVHIYGGASGQVVPVHAVGHEPTSLYKF